MTHIATCSSATSSPCLSVQRVPASAVGCFKLMPHRALTLTLKTPGLLCVAHGSAWVTFADAASDNSVRAGDHFLNAGQSLQIRTGQAIVLEASSLELYFDFTFDAQQLVVFYKPTPARDSWLAVANNGWKAFGSWLANHWQSAHASAQTHPHPFAAAARGCQS